MNNCNCNPCKPKCESPCGCPEPVFSIEALPTDPTVLRFNVNGKSVWYDFEPIVKAGESNTALTVDAVARTLNYHGERSENTLTARELGSILHLADLGDVDANTIENNGILNYRKETDCGEGCEGISAGWTATNPVEVGATSLDYLLGSDADGEMASLMPPTTPNKFSYLAWAGAGKISWRTPTEIASVSDNYAPLYLDKTTGEIVVLGGNS